MYDHGLEQKEANAGGSGVEGWMGIKGELDNCNSIINEIDFQKAKKPLIFYPMYF